MAADQVRATVRIDGVVQGVGFRPFVYRTALDAGVSGYVRNAGGTVDAAFESDRSSVESVLETLRAENPPLSRVDRVDVTWTDPVGTDGFEIRDSSTDGTTDSGSGGGAPVPPDTGICDRCLADVRDPDSLYHSYWATSCVDCGPRFSVVRGVPYDRDRTSMDEFPLCEDCRDRYEEPADRRYHAQAVACANCGPTLRYEADPAASVANGSAAIARAASALADGEIVGLKGTGGTHFVCDATDPDVVDRLRERTGRPTKPFAVMAPDVASVNSFALVDGNERELLEDVRRPIVLLEGDDETTWLDEIAPGLHTVGVALPYAGVHHLLFDHVEEPLVMTSANRPGEPMVTSATDLWERLGDVVDGALVHDRTIVNRCDDSVVRTVDGKRRFLRRSRGWTPMALPAVDDADEGPAVLALGPERDVTVAVADGDRVVPSQHVGDVDGPDGLAFLEEAVDRLTALTGIEPDVVACDLHPEFTTTEWARRYAENGDENLLRVQHHHAHAAALCAEHDLERTVAIVADGTGYGPDGTIWGGEVLDVTPADFERVGGLEQFSLPGGRAAIREPARILASLLADEERIDERLLATDVAETPTEAAVVRQEAERGVNTPTTTSAGRYLDAVSALLDVCGRRRYEGEPAMRLEAAAHDGSPRSIDLEFTSRNGQRTLDVRALVTDLAAMTEEYPQADVAATAQEALARGLGRIAVETAHERDLETVGFTGGIAYNDAITAAIRRHVTEAGLSFATPVDAPAGDGGVSYGQAIVARARGGRGRNR
ncbi:hydrogenase maturation protein HypF [Halobiforma haloterrestris]|uniref:Carbamoyltransferase n=1 Tax=Natronobacterium haloterrestre TaxID=148448 RepID=A0A1I1JVH5_NATHA|nr:carbamoyltransferase HypF [Halobiforma haloterrestris]SFC49370.1 hydrogenase maturation protein HypF [Halobiforma haloterrestris]